MGKGRDPYTLVGPVRRVLLEEWDPIGRAPEDEYDSYLPTIIRLLTEGADVHRLADHLHKLQTVSMGIAGNREKCWRSAEKLRALVEGKGEM